MNQITISQNIKATPAQVYKSYLDPEDNKRWNTAGGGWTVGETGFETRVGGRWFAVYKNPEGINDFTLEGVFTELVENKKICYQMPNKMGGFDVESRNVEVLIESISHEESKITLTFDAENINSLELQKQGWNSILQNFKTFIERKVNPKNTVYNGSITINSPKSKVWNTLINKENYKIWTEPFCQGSYYEGDMKYNSIIHFLSPDKSGLLSKVIVCIPDFQISFEHLGALKDGKEIFDDPEFLEWKGARETYTLTEKDNVTMLEIYQDLGSEELEFFTIKWDQALKIVKEISENP